MKVVVFGGTGAAGSGLLRACLADPRVSKIVAPTRRPLQPPHSSKLQEVEVPDFGDLSALQPHVREVDACFYALGVSQSQVSDEARYRVIVHDYALAAARLLAAESPEHAFHFVSGRSTKPGSRFMWARVKAETEDDLAGIGLARLVCYRPGYIHPDSMRDQPILGEGIARTLYPLFSRFRGLSVRARQIGEAMLQAQAEGLPDGVLENAEMRLLSQRYAASAPRR